MSNVILTSFEREVLFHFFLLMIMFVLMFINFFPLEVFTKEKLLHLNLQFV